MGGLTLEAGVYKFDSSASLAGILVLNANGNPNTRFDFLIGSTLITASSALVELSGGAQADDIFWQVGSSATLGTDTAFAGTILADASITLNTAASLDGRVLALNGAVTLDDNAITVPTVVLETAPMWLMLAGSSLFALRTLPARRSRSTE